MRGQHTTHSVGSMPRAVIARSSELAHAPLRNGNPQPQIHGLMAAGKLASSW
jgi:hypothetical protein